MTMTLPQRVLAYLQSIAPHTATNSDIRHNLGVKSHQQVYLITQALRQARTIHSRRLGYDWEFWVEAAPIKPIPPEKPPPPAALVELVSDSMTSYRFETLAQVVMSRHYGVSLQKGSLPGVRKIFDLVSADSQIVGDAKYYTLVGGERLPPAKFSVIAEHVWLLEKSSAKHCFLVFGNDIRVPQQWLERYENLVAGVEFYFLSDNGQLHQLRS